MQVSELIPASILKATGEVYAGTPGDSDWKKMLALSNFNQRSWAREPGGDWDSTYEDLEIGTISATDAFDLDDTIISLSTDPDDFVVIVHSDGNTSRYKTVKASKLKCKQFGNYCAKVGQQLKFNHAFQSTDKEIGGTLIVPAHIQPDDLEKDADTVAVDDPNWLVCMNAAAWVQSDVTLAQNRPDHIAEASNLMTAMKAANKGQSNQMGKEPLVRGTEW